MRTFDPFAIGGDDTLSYAAKLNDLGVKIIAIPKTMDNDVPQHAEYRIGFLDRDYPRQRRHPAASTNVVTVPERPAFSASLGATPDLRRSTPHTPPQYGASYREYKVNLDKLIQLLLEEKRTQATKALSCSARALSGGREQAPVTWAIDAGGHRKKASVADRLPTRQAQRERPSPLTSPTTCDRAIGTSSTSQSQDFFGVGYGHYPEGKTGLMSALMEGC